MSGRSGPDAPRRLIDGARRLAMLLLVGAPLLLLGGPAPAVQNPATGKIQGVSLVAPRERTPPERMARVAGMGAGWVAVVPYAFVRRSSGEVRFRGGGEGRSEPNGRTRRQIEQARAHGLKVLLKPHLWIRGSGWAGTYAPASEVAWEAFAAGYRAYLLGAARLAEELGVEMLCVGTELSRLVAERPEFFRGLIGEVREVYGGELTYAANWDAYADVPFWDALDYVGVDAYFPLSNRPRPPVHELEVAWRPLVRELRRFSERHGRPILFTEFGYRAMEGAAGEQWTLPDVRRSDPGRAEPRAQVRAYEALFRTWWHRPWFAGGFLWKWYLDELEGERAERILTTGYTPQGKPVEALIRRWWRGEREP